MRLSLVSFLSQTLFKQLEKVDNNLWKAEKSKKKYQNISIINVETVSQSNKKIKDTYLENWKSNKQRQYFENCFL